jgi:hypothetical protein
MKATCQCEVFTKPNGYFMVFSIEIFSAEVYANLTIGVTSIDC